MLGAVTVVVASKVKCLVASAEDSCAESWTLERRTLLVFGGDASAVIEGATRVLAAAAGEDLVRASSSAAACERCDLRYATLGSGAARARA